MTNCKLCSQWEVLGLVNQKRSFDKTVIVKGEVLGLVNQKRSFDHDSKGGHG